MRPIVQTLLCSFLILSCDIYPNSPEIISNAINFELGNEKIYKWSFIEVDSAGNQLFAVSDSVLVRVGAIEDELPGYRNLIRLEAWSLSGRPLKKQRVWYHQSQEALTEIAYAFAGAVPFVLPKRNSIIADLSTLSRHITPLSTPIAIQLKLGASDATMDSIRFRTDPRIVYRYPVTPGREWVSFREPFLQTRKVVGAEEITVQAGTFICAKIKTEIPEFNSDIEWYDFVNNGGLALRTLRIKMLRTDEHGNVIGTSWMNERVELVAISNSQ